MNHDPVETDSDGSPPTLDRPPMHPADRVFWFLVVIAGPLIAVNNPDQWFRADEFTFLFKRELGDPASWFAPHWGHLTALPVIAFQALYRLTGLHQYWPYQWLAIASHLIVAVLAHRLIRRAGVGPWLATAAVAPFLFLGAGRDNLTWGFQITLTGSLALGLGALVVLAGPRGASRRGHVVAGSLLAGSVLCSNVGLVMVAVATGAVLVAAAASRTTSRQTMLERLLMVAGPATVVYLAWVALAPESEWGHRPSGSDAALRFALSSLGGAGHGYSRWSLVAIALALTAVVGLGLLARRIIETPDIDMGTAAAVALLVGTILMALLLGYGRASDPAVNAHTSRYVYLIVALGLVPVAVAVHEVVRRHGPVAMAAGCMLMLMGLPGNLSRLGPEDGEPDGSRTELVRMAELTIDSEIPDDEIVWGDTTAGALRMAVRDGVLPGPGADPEAAARAMVKVTVRLDDDPGGACTDVDPAEPTEFRAGDHLVFHSDLTLRHASDDGPRGRVTWQAVADPTSVVVRRGPVQMWLSSSSETPVRRCR